MRTMAERYQALRGTRDILPEEVAVWRSLEDTTHDVFSRYGFREIRTPIFETTELFARSVGTATDIVRKEMYTFKAGDESVTLRPENTAPVVRAVVEHSLHRTIAEGFPTRLYYLGPMFRYERPQAGRFRQFYQIDVEAIGEASPVVRLDGRRIDTYRGASFVQATADASASGMSRCTNASNRRVEFLGTPIISASGCAIFTG
jgi:histidyl-tRNA synthetase